MNKFRIQLATLSFSIFLLIVGCSSLSESESVAETQPNSSEPSNPAADVTSEPNTEEFTPSAPNESYPALAYPPPLGPTLTAPYPGPMPTPQLTQPRPTATPTIVVQSLSAPSFSGYCGEELTGKLAFFQENGQLTVFDYDTCSAWYSTQVNLRDAVWSPTGDRLLVHTNNQDTYFYSPDGECLHSESNGFVTWDRTGQLRPNNPHVWNEDSSVSVYIKTVQDAAGNWEHIAQVDDVNGNGRTEWSLEIFSPRFGVVAVLEWVPYSDWVLLGYANGGVATHLATGYRLAALNVRSGEIVDSGLSTPGIAQIDWHPTIPGLLATADLQAADVSGLGHLATWQVFENRVERWATPTDYIRGPVWSPNGRYLAYQIYDLAPGMGIGVTDIETNEAETWTEQGIWPQWSRDSSTLFYLEMLEPDNDLVRILAKSREAPPIMVTQTRHPGCYGFCEPQNFFDYTP